VNIEVERGLAPTVHSGRTQMLGLTLGVHITTEVEVQRRRTKSYWCILLFIYIMEVAWTTLG